jgi:hypothetical protein
MAESRGIEGLPVVLEEYGRLRDLGHDHSMAKDAILAVFRTTSNVRTDITMTTLPMPPTTSLFEEQVRELKKRKVENDKKLLRKKLLEDNIRMIRDD